MQTEWDGCRACTIRCGKQVGQYVHFRGEIPCEILFIGESPGEEESLTGKPFVGRPGEILNKWIDAAIDDERYCITNLVACRPTQYNPERRRVKNRAPTKEEITACEDHLLDIYYASGADVVVTLGRTAETNLPDELHTASVPLLHLPHPAHVARKGGETSILFAESRLKLKTFVEEQLHGQA